MQKIENFPQRRSLFIFDLEFIGDVRNLETCKIWEVAVYSVQKGLWFKAVVDPDPTLQVFPPPPIEELPQLTREFLTNENALPWLKIFPRLSEWVQTMCLVGQVPVFISHNTFRADKPILEFECQRSGLKMPYEWYFFDSLHYSRFRMRQSSGNYSLTGIYTTLFNETFENAHRAEADVRACHRILAQLTNNTWTLTGPMYPTYSTSLRAVRWVGQRAEMLLNNEEIHSLEALLLLVQKNVRSDYLTNCLEETNSIRQTVRKLFHTDSTTTLPLDNVENIATSLIEMLHSRPFSHSFVLKSQMSATTH
jgi:DNA polymerase III epsilon subunit-like protein